MGRGSCATGSLSGTLSSFGFTDAPRECHEGCESSCCRDCECGYPQQGGVSMHARAQLQTKEFKPPVSPEGRSCCRHGAWRWSGLAVRRIAGPAARVHGGVRSFQRHALLARRHECALPLLHAGPTSSSSEDNRVSGSLSMPSASGAFKKSVGKPAIHARQSVKRLGVAPPRGRCTRSVG